MYAAKYILGTKYQCIHLIEFVFERETESEPRSDRETERERDREAHTYRERERDYSREWQN